jgi:hypothetical protein
VNATGNVTTLQGHEIATIKFALMFLSHASRPNARTAMLKQDIDTYATHEALRETCDSLARRIGNIPLNEEAKADYDAFVDDMDKAAKAMGQW